VPDLDAMLDDLVDAVARAAGAAAATPAERPPSGITRADLKTMTAEEIVQAKADGKLDELLGITR
jgi:hypothetical protein